MSPEAEKDGKQVLIEQTFSGFIIVTQKYIHDYSWVFSPGLSNTPPHQKSILAMSTDDPDTHRLWFRTQRSWMHRSQVDDSFAVEEKKLFKKFLILRIPTPLSYPPLLACLSSSTSCTFKIPPCPPTLSQNPRGRALLKLQVPNFPLG